MHDAIAIEQRIGQDRRVKCYLGCDMVEPLSEARSGIHEICVELLMRRSRYEIEGDEVRITDRL